MLDSTSLYVSNTLRPRIVITEFTMDFCFILLMLCLLFLIEMRERKERHLLSYYLRFCKALICFFWRFIVFCMAWIFLSNPVTFVLVLLFWRFKLFSMLSSFLSKLAIFGLMSFSIMLITTQFPDGGLAVTLLFCKMNIKKDIVYFHSYVF